MNLRLPLLIFQLLLISLSISARGFTDTELHYRNGKVKNCLILLPVDADDAKIVIKDNKDSKRKSVTADEVHKFIISLYKRNLVIKRTHLYRWKKNGTKKISKKPYFIKETLACQEFSLYNGIRSFDIDKKGNFKETYLEGVSAYLLQRDGEKYPCHVGYLVFYGSFVHPSKEKGINKKRKQLLENYYSNDKKAIKFLRSKSEISESEFIEWMFLQCYQ